MESTPPPHEKSSFLGLTSDIFCLASWVTLCIITWDSWIEPFVDVGRELYVPWVLSLGQKLFADIAYFNGPISPWWNSVWFKISGPSIRSLTLLNLGLSLAFTLYLNRQLRNRFGVLSATTATVFFISVFIFPQITQNNAFNYVLPYSHEMTHGLYLCFMVLFTLNPISGKSPSRIYQIIAGFLSGLVFMLKPELFIALAAAIISLLIAHWSLRIIHRKATNAKSSNDADFWSDSDILSTVGFWLAGIIVTFLSTAVILATYLAPGKAITAATGAWRYVFSSSVSNTTFYQFISGMDDPGNSLGKILIYTLYVLIAVLLLPMIIRMSKGLEPHNISLIVTTTTILLLTTGTLFFNSVPWTDLPRCMPLLLTLCICFLALKTFRISGHCHAHYTLQWLPLFTFALVLLLKIILFSRLYHYGFVLGMPAIITLICFGLNIGTTSYKTHRHSRWSNQLYLTGLCVFLAYGHLKPAYINHMRKTEHFKSADNHFYMTPYRYRYLTEILSAVKNNLAKDDTLAVIPQGAAVNFLSSHLTSVPYLIFMPTELAMYDEDHMISIFAANPPDYILLRDRSTAEHGVEFGQSYGLKLTYWIQHNYQLQQQIIPKQSGTLFGVQLLKYNPPVAHEKSSGTHGESAIETSESAGVVIAGEAR